MKRIINFSKRNFKEIIRDPLSIIFAILLPLFLLFIFQQFKIPNEVYKIENFTPGIIIFSFSFITLFTASLVAKDRTTSLLARLGTSPMKPIEYILGYTLAVMPLVIIQNILFFSVALLFGLSFSLSILAVVLGSLVLSTLFIFLGILIGSVTSEKAANGVSSIVVQLVAFTSGMYFSNDLIGKGFKIVCDVLPFSHSLEILKAILFNNYENIFISIPIVLGYTIVIAIIATIVFKKKMIED